jgi:hypothetical protein
MLWTLRGLTRTTHGSVRMHRHGRNCSLFSNAHQLPKLTFRQGAPRGGLASLIWAILGNARRQLWEIWHSRQRGICNLQILGPARGFESHPHRLRAEGSRRSAESTMYVYAPRSVSDDRMPFEIIPLHQPKRIRTDKRPYLRRSLYLIMPSLSGIARYCPLSEAIRALGSEFCRTQSRSKPAQTAR